MSEIGRCPMFFHKQVEKLLQSHDTSRCDAVYQFEGILFFWFSNSSWTKERSLLSPFKKTRVRNFKLLYIKYENYIKS